MGTTTNKHTHNTTHTHYTAENDFKGGTAREKIFREKTKTIQQRKKSKRSFFAHFLFSLLYLRRAGREDAQLGVSKPVSPLIKGSTTLTKCERRGKPASPCS